MPSLKELSIDPSILNATHDLTVHVAARKGNIEILKSLMRLQGAEIINAEDSWEESPLHIAVYSNKLEVVRFLVNNGGDLEATDKHGASPLLRAMQYLTFNSEGVNSLIQRPKTWMEKAQETRVEIVKFLLKNCTKANINSKHLVSMVKCNHLEILEQILKLDINPTDQTLALKEAIIKNNEKAVNILLAYGADTKDNNNNFALFFNEKKVKALMECVNAIDSLCYEFTIEGELLLKSDSITELEAVSGTLVVLGEGGKIALSNRVLYKLLGGRHLSMSQLQKNINEFVAVVFKICDKVAIDISFLNTKITELFEDIKSANILIEGEVSSLFYKAIKVLKKYDLWNKASVAENENNGTILSQDIIDKAEGREGAEVRVNECLAAAFIRLVSNEDASTVDIMGGEANIHDYST